MIRKVLKLLFVFIFGFGFVLCASASAISSDNSSGTVLKGGVTMVPNSFYGVWRVVSKRIDTDSAFTFKENNVDLWNLSKRGNVITLSNPFSGASAEIIVSSTNADKITFTKKGKYDNKYLTDTVELKLAGNTFVGYDTLQLDTFSDVNGKIIKTETAKYSIKGEKIAGDSK